MSKQIDSIDNELRDWLHAQHVFFVATAPNNSGDHINCSPKGGDAFRVLNPMQVGYLDYTGSGIETAAHLQENGRIVVMFCAFDGRPNVVRMHGTGTYLPTGDPRFCALIESFPDNPGTRGIVLVDVSRISTSCGFSVPLMDFNADRDVLDKWAVSKGPDGLTEYRAAKNARSIDGLPGI